MQSTKIKEYLLQIADKVTPETTLEDIYNQLALLSDIEESENEVNEGKVFTQDQVEQKAKDVEEALQELDNKLLLRRFLVRLEIWNRLHESVRSSRCLNIKKSEYRYLVVWSYKVIYKVEKDRVVVSRIFHSSQDPNKLKGV